MDTGEDHVLSGELPRFYEHTAHCLKSFAAVESCKGLIAAVDSHRTSFLGTYGEPAGRRHTVSRLAMVPGDPPPLLQRRRFVGKAPGPELAENVAEPIRVPCRLGL